jgi:hypothetical protein
MDLSGRRKIELFLKVLRILGEHFQLVNMSTHARAIIHRGGLSERAAMNGHVSTAPATTSPAPQLRAER